ncbi:MAG: DUF3857 domain-containing protein [Bacteroidales bacterium]|nr:DUF3857 domain-containing protein [Bacteroidales bacterium]
MRKLFYLLLLILISTQLIAESPVKKFGKFSKEELSFSTFKKDSSAEAVILFDKGRAYFNYIEPYGFRLMFDRHVRIKILKKSGFNYGDFEIPLYRTPSGKEKLTGLKAVTYNTIDGKTEKNKLKNSGIYKDDHNSNWLIIRFSMPNVNVGSIVEVKYTIMSEFNYKLPEWSFQDYIPVLWSEYQVEIPEYYHYNVISKGYLPYVINESSIVTNNIQIQSKTRSAGKGHGAPTEQTLNPTTNIPVVTKILKMAVKDAPSMKNEAYMLTSKNYISQIHFELAREKWPGQTERHYTKSWESINEKLLKHQNFGERLRFGKFISKDDTKKIIEGSESNEEKISAIFNYVKNNFKWDKTYGVFTNSSLKEVFDNKSGNVADINLLLVLLLQNAEIDAHPAILSTRNHGLLNLIYPSVDQMNYVVAYIRYNGKEVLLDATEPNCPINMLPPRCLNDKVRVISEKYSKWIEVNNENSSKKSVTTQININEDGSKGSIKVVREGYSAFLFRNSLSSKNNPDEYINEFEDDNSGIKVNEYKFENNIDVSASVINDYNDISVETIDYLGNMIYFSPVIIDKTISNPFVLENREFPVDYNYPLENSYTFTYIIPENFSVDEIPTSEQFILPNNSAEYKYSATANGKTIEIKIEYKINKRVFLPNEYTELKEFYNKIIDKENKQIVLKKS